MDQIFIPESPKNCCFQEFCIDESIEDIFPLTFKHMEILDEINENDLYYINKQKIKDNKINNETNENSSFIFDDYETFYNKFAGIKENNLISYNEFNNPCFVLNYDMEQKLIYSPIEDENIYKIENENLSKGKSKEKILVVIKETNSEENKERKEKKPENKEKKNTYFIIKKKPRRRKKKIQIDTSEKYFPFKRGKGIIDSLKPDDESILPTLDNLNSSFIQSQETLTLNKQEYNPYNNYEEKIKKDVKIYHGENKEESKEESINVKNKKYNESINSQNDIFIFKFKTKKYFYASNGKKRKVQKKRKFKPDDIRKKIKSRFHKTLKNIINDNLKKAGSKELFDFLPQCFIGNVSKKTNTKCFELTYKELLSTDFHEELNKEGYKYSKVDNNKCNKNIKVLKYLENNPEICKRSGFDLIKDKKYKDILKLYFASAEFENSLFQLKEEKESPEYIQEYISKAKNYVNFYSNFKKKDNQQEVDNVEENEENEEDSKDH